MDYMPYVLIFILVFVLMLVKSFISKNNKKNNISYKKKYLLTKNEYNFFYKLKPIAEKYNLSILCKIRLADLIEPAYHADRHEWYAAFNKIKSKHIDFVLTTQNMNVLLLIELEDSSHDKAERIERDNFVKSAIESADLKLLCVYNNNDAIKIVDEKLRSIIK